MGHKSPSSIRWLQHFIATESQEILATRRAVAASQKELHTGNIVAHGSHALGAYAYRNRLLNLSRPRIRSRNATLGVTPDHAGHKHTPIPYTYSKKRHCLVCGERAP